MKTLVQALFGVASLLISMTLAAQDRADLEGTTITGNRELPKVLYIVPWKKAEAGETGRPVTSLIDEVLAPVDRDVFRRQVDYFESLQHGKNQGVAGR